MSSDPDRQLKRPEFLEREVYRQRRLIDAIKLLPVLGVILFLTPALIVGTSVGSTAHALVYFFAVWLGMIVLCAVLSRSRARGGD